LKLLKQFSLSLICTFAFTVALIPATYARGLFSTGFKVATNINFEAGLFGVVAADFNGDAHLDLIAPPNNSLGEVLLLLGRGGTEKFGLPASVPVGDSHGNWRSAISMRTVKPDLVVSLDSFGQPSGRFAVLFNDGTGKFGAPNTSCSPFLYS